VQVVFSYYNIAFELYTGFHLTFHKKPQISSGFCKMVSETGDMPSGKTETNLRMGFFAGCFRFLHADKWSYQGGNGMFGI